MILSVYINIEYNFYDIKDKNDIQEIKYNYVIILYILNLILINPLFRCFKKI